MLCYFLLKAEVFGKSRGSRRTRVVAVLIPKSVASVWYLSPARGQHRQRHDVQHCTNNTSKLCGDRISELKALQLCEVGS